MKPLPDDPRCLCGSRARLTDGREIYPHRADLHDLLFWKCKRCSDSHVGCHRGTQTPLGTAADRETRAQRSAVHRAFDPLWKGDRAVGRARFGTRKAAYQWLAQELGIPFSHCHVGRFDKELCLLALAAIGRLSMEIR